jgi:pyruvate kinase
MDIAGPKCRVATIAAPGKPRVFCDDTVLLKSKVRKRAHCISMTVNLPEVLEQIPVGARVLVDDGSAEMIVEEIAEAGLVLRVRRAPRKGLKLRPGKGLNFPGIDLSLPALMAKDFEDLDFVAEHADLVGLSFVRNASDVALMQDELSSRRASRPPQPIVIKVETRSAVENLPDIIVQGAGRQPLALMIARGDLAVEVGFDRIGELQEQILWLCEAAHIPVIWATEVLSGLVKTGAPTRAEATDASMAQRAECVMLNKGPHLVEAVKFLDGVLHRMDRHQSKKSARLRPLEVWAIGGGA